MAAPRRLPGRAEPRDSIVGHVVAPDVAEVERIAALAHLALTEDEKAQFTRQLADILTYVTQIEQVAIDGVPPTSHALLPRTTLRDDARCAVAVRVTRRLAAAPGAAKTPGCSGCPEVIGG